MSRLAVVALLMLVSPACPALELTGDTGIHDPSRIYEQDGRYYTFGTGNNFSPIRALWSDDLVNWSAGPRPFDAVPSWALDLVPDNGDTNMWAPDVIRLGDEYRMYYSVSSFGSQRSVIGLATNTTLDFNHSDYEWVDRGLVIDSVPGDPYNAIDAGLLYDDEQQRLWMTFGSYWNGVHAVELSARTGKVLGGSGSPINLARNATSGVNAIEGAHLTEHAGEYFLFVNWDACCQGLDSTYKMVVGRGDSPTGPFYDRSGDDLRFGGGDLFFATEGDTIGPGHFADFTEDGADYFSHHYYDGASNGFARLGIDEFVWAYDGWPVRVDDLPAGDYNQDGRVDAADYAVWRETLGSTTDLRADGATGRGSGGVIDQQDLALWRVQYGATYSVPTLAASLAVPEPSAVLLAATAALAGARRRG